MLTSKVKRGPKHVHFDFNPNIVNERFRPLLNKSQRYQIVFGGSGSSKSYSVFSMVPMWLLEGRSILCIRENDAHIKKSVWREVLKAIQRQKLTKYFRINKTDKTIECKISKGSMVTSGVKDVEKLKSITPIWAESFDTIIIEEATELKSPSIVNAILARQRAVQNFPTRCLFLFNPINKSHHLYERFFKPIEKTHNFNKGRECIYYEDEVTLIHKSTWEDNPYTTEADLQMYKDMKLNDSVQHNVLCNGNFGVFGDRVYDQNITYVDKLSADIKKLPWRIGIDHGYHDARTLCITKWDEKNNTIYVVDTLQKRKSLPDAFAVQAKLLFEKWGVPLNHQITADSNDATTNAMFAQYGLNIRRAIKGAGSKFVGLMWLKMRRIVVPRRLIDFKDSVEVYTWKKDKNGISTEDTNHDGSDMLDGLRYGYELHFIGHQKTMGARVKI